MNETKALERALNVVLGNNVLSESYGGVFRQAAAELARLRAELEMNKANLESFMQLRDENSKLCALLAEKYQIYLQICAEIDRYDKVCTEIRNELTAAGIPELTEDRLTVLPLVKRVAQLRTDLADSTAQMVLDECEIQKLRAELKEAIRVIEMQKNSLIIWKSVYREAWTENDQERIDIASTFLEAHKETK
jgi:hypothetical protein